MSIFGHLPGDIIPAESGFYCEMCENAGDHTAATHIVVGETDSFGSEFHYCCKDHSAMLSQRVKQSAYETPCERCGGNELVKAFRDPEEGFGGPVYHYCITCRTAIKEAFCGDPDEDWSTDTYWDE